MPSFQTLGFASYGDYLLSPHWLAFKDRFFAARKRRCFACRKRQGIELHHITYNRIGAERLDDVVPLCGRCHDRVHHLIASGCPKNTAHHRAQQEHAAAPPVPQPAKPKRARPPKPKKAKPGPVWWVAVAKVREKAAPDALVTKTFHVQVRADRGRLSAEKNWEGVFGGKHFLHSFVSLAPDPAYQPKAKPRKRKGPALHR
jgi:hypothetical protein